MPKINSCGMLIIFQSHYPARSTGHKTSSKPECSGIPILPVGLKKNKIGK